MGQEECGLKNLVRDRKGDAVMVTSVLLLSLLLSVGGKLLLDQGEIQGKEDDMLHVADVESSMLRTRSSMLVLQENQDHSMVIMNRVTLGTYGSPYLGVARSSGELSFDPSSDEYHMGIYLEEGGTRSLLNSINGQLKFESNNFYYHDQNLFFQSGGIVRDEYGSYAVAWSPSIDIIKGPSTWAIYGNIYGMTGSKWSITGIESISMIIRMAGSSDVSHVLSAGQTIVLVYDGDTNSAWEEWWRSTAQLNGLTVGTDIDLTWPSGISGPLEVELISLESIKLNIGDMEVSI